MYTFSEENNSTFYFWHDYKHTKLFYVYIYQTLSSLYTKELIQTGTQIKESQDTI